MALASSQADNVDDPEPNGGLPTESVEAARAKPTTASSNEPSLTDLIIDAAPTVVDVPLSLAEQRRQRDQTVWQRETLAQHYERALVQLWDRLLAEQCKPRPVNKLKRH